MDTNRLEAFSDGVFAIAITLLILEVHVPAVPPGQHASLAHQLGRAWPDYVAYAISFVTIGIMWANHHAIFRLIERATHGLIVLNMLLLMSVSFLPFPTKVLGQNLTTADGDQRTAAILFSGTFLVTALLYNALWQTAVWQNRLIKPGQEQAAAQVSRRFNVGPPSYLLAFLLAFWSMPA
ncbi:MAG: TMEM175 family protein, partial [Actinomycetota bacterium]|nr:TMEM175 family protein [Actinomycetota bacterium]